MPKTTKPASKSEPDAAPVTQPHAAPAGNPKQPEAEGESVLYMLVWEGVTLTISYEAGWLRSATEGHSGFAHLQIQVSEPEGAPLPITETGYRSHFLLSGIVEEAGGPAAYVRRWLDEAARSPHWKRVRDRGRQYSLF